MSSAVVVVRRWAARPPGVAAVVGVALATFGLRLWLAGRVHAPFMFHDEGSYVAVGRALLGEPPELFGPRYAVGYGVLLAPALAILDPAGAYLTGKVLNAAAAAALVPVLFVLARRVVATPPWLALVAAVAGSTTASLLVQSTMLLPEALLALATALSLLLLHRLASRPSLPGAAGFGLAVGSAAALHTRGIALVLAAAVVLVGGAAARRVPRGAVAMALVTAAAIVIASQVALRWTTTQLYPLAASGKDAGDLMALIEDPAGVALTAVGHLWYVVFATGGLAALGLAWAVITAARSGDTARRMVAACVAIGFVTSLVLSALAHGGVVEGFADRPDKLVYGRYLQQWTPVLVVLAPGLVAGLSRRLASLAAGGVAAFSLSAAWVLGTRYDASVWDGPIAWHNAPMLWLIDALWGGAAVVEAAVVFAIGAGVVLLWTVRGRSPVRWAVPLAAMLLGNVFVGTDIVGEWARPASERWDDGHRLGVALETIGEPVAVVLSSPDAIFYAYNLQFWHPTIDVDLRGPDTPNPAPLVVAPVDDPPPAPAWLIGSEDRVDVALWVVDPELADELRQRGTDRRAPEPAGAGDR